jgi:hypothetical protein
VPAGSELVVIAGGSGFTASVKALVVLPPPLSVSITVKLELPVSEGVPLITPVEPWRLKPRGKIPSDIAQVTGATAPDAARVVEYEAPAVAFGRLDVVITGLEFTVNCRACVAVAAASSCTFTVNDVVPAPVGVPLMTPALLSVRPAGSAWAEMDHE